MLGAHERCGGTNGIAWRRAARDNRGRRSHSDRLRARDRRSGCGARVRDRRGRRAWRDFPCAVRRDPLGRDDHRSTPPGALDGRPLLGRCPNRRLGHRGRDAPFDTRSDGRGRGRNGSCRRLGHDGRGHGHGRGRLDDRSGCGRLGSRDNDRRGRRLRLGDRRRRGRDGRRGEGWQQAEWVDIAVGIRRHADTEVDVRRGRDLVGALADGSDDVALGDDAAAQDARRAELQQGHRIAVGGLNRDRVTAAWDRADERDRSRGRGEHRAAEPGADVDPAVLPRGVGVRPERERAQHRSGRRPRPGVCGRHRNQGRDQGRQQDEDRDDPPHEGTAFAEVEGLPDHASGVIQRLFNDSAYSVLRETRASRATTSAA